ncbi:MAG: hypothetical protein A3F31_04895 [Candidatus Levybacteria bacterium RIFCSPHIGHO2_12_FULL_38_12]|nr:MAG: hypothetical protein A3D75_01010 [Candidatus Levybacteria bacterium RIFCSPHIGHO2_02_FULL_37_18]OGH22589.1 MAG: hypothetical protein A3F31_04895 [Candidatus Levybacteria bacterium RIFCSPHIGHO2_12_FULL_38_12]OGH33374.1 MAG: hypothetical protein A3A47_03960 [Candidatus Levybacteria bacterium RIFCSPLOWO2_01_FULL_37_20]OGH44127.1 MAG: hypothetical protein A3J14_05265 [Candidatus Levybacteria bacterium RIFCSPLOWO2_02_FULL_37_18]
MKILAIHFHSHDTSVVLIENGTVLYAAGNERFSRKKMDRSIPIQALRDCLKYTHTAPGEIDKVVFVGDSLPRAFLNRFKELSVVPIITRGEYFIWWKKLHYILREIIIATGIPTFFYRDFIPRIVLKKELHGYKGTYSCVHHHLAHSYSTYYTSLWEECLVMAIEGSGLNETMSIFKVTNGKWVKLMESRLPNSAGRFYELATQLLGFNLYRHAGKVTGLAAYGNPEKAYHKIKELISVEGENLNLNIRTFFKWHIGYFLTHQLPLELSTYSKEDIAAAFQRRLEECVLEIVKKVAQETGIRRLAIAGGVAANVKLNQKLHELKEIDEIHIHQAMGDDGLALGAALHTAFLHGFKPGKLNTLYLGPDFSDQEIHKALKKYNVQYTKEKNIEKKVAQLVADGKVVARFNGRMEYGPRALGNRSILYQTTDKTVNDWLNKRLKRTEFMPFAPVTLEEYAKKCYKNVKGAEYPARFMTLTFACTDYMKKVSPAVVHVDGTARPQIIRKEDNTNYYKIVEEYFKITKIPSLVNTSFNMHEEPIVCTPDDALRAFLSGELDYLAIGEYLVSRKP